MPRKPPKPRKRAYGSILQRGDSWEVRWREKGRRRTASFPDKETAEKVLLRIVGDVAAGRGGLEAAAAVAAALRAREKWLERREHTHRSWRGDRNLWNKHLEPPFGHLRRPRSTRRRIRRLIEAKLADGLSSQTVGNIVRLLSTFYTRRRRAGLRADQPGARAPALDAAADQEHARPETDARSSRSRSDIARIYSELAQPFATIFAVGALAACGPAEIIGLEWGDVDLDARRMLVQRQVRHGRVGPTKSGKPRLVPIIEPLAKILAEWKLATGGEGLLFKPLTPWRTAEQVHQGQHACARRSARRSRRAGYPRR